MADHYLVGEVGQVQFLLLGVADSIALLQRITVWILFPPLRSLML